MASKNKGKIHMRAQWGSNIGFILAAAGSAVGLGNIWKFPGRAYQGGGGAFILIYILIVAFIGAAVMLAELTVGRKTQKNVVGAYKALGHPRWKWVGGMGVLCGYIISCYYIQVGGWVLRYVFSYIFSADAVYADPNGYFLNMLGQNGFPWIGAVVCPLIFISATAVVLLKGISSGIERFSKIVMPALLAILVVLTVRSVTLPGADEGIKYLLTFDWSKLTASTLLSALGQAFYSLSLGMAIMITYGSYLKKEENLVKNTGLICTLDTVIALVAAFMIIPAVFATDVEPGIGGGFAFASLAGVFEKLPVGELFGVLFYLLLLVAALTSEISILEGTTAYVTEQWHWSRKKAIIVLAVSSFVIGIFYTLSQSYLPIKGIWMDITNGVQFPSFGDFMEYVTDRLLMPLGALLFCIFVGWVWKPKHAITEIEQHSVGFRLKKVWTVLIKFVAPAAIFAILVSGLLFGMSLS